MIFTIVIWVLLSVFVVGLWALAAEFTGFRRGRAVDKKYRRPAVASLEAVGPQTGVIVMSARTDTELIPIVHAASRV
jgi:hypothetical protein